MPIVLSVASIFAITFVVWLLNKALPFKVCPVCAGVSGTWLVLTAAILAGLVSGEELKTVVALLMGGTVVGIAYQGEKVCSWAKIHGLVWKLLVIGFGLPMAYLSIVYMGPLTLTGEIVFLATMLYLLFVGPHLKTKGQMRSANEAEIERLERKLDDCCS